MSHVKNCSMVGRILDLEPQDLGSNLNNLVILGESLAFSGPQFPYLENEGIILDDF